jgi:glucose/mannose-6-phosphate isomerase
MNTQGALQFRQNILESLDQFQVGFEVAKPVEVEGVFRGMVISGMGGSALPAGLVNIYCQDVALRQGGEGFSLIENRTYSLPFYTKQVSYLQVVCSYSGNTEESLSCLEEAIANKLPCVGVSAGGKLAERCLEAGIPHVKIPTPTPTFQPRLATGYFFAALLQLAMNMKLLPDVTEEVLLGALEVKKNREILEKQGKHIATRLLGKTPVVYSNFQYEAVARIWKIKINENAKTPAFWNFLPEMNHNEMVGYTLPQGDFHTLLLRDSSDNPKNKKRYEVLLPILAEKGVAGEIVDILGDTVYTRVFNTLVLGDFVAYHLSLLYEVDPEPVEMVEAFKKLL